MITRIWEGRREYTGTPYWRGQVLIQGGGPKHGMWKDASTNFHATEREAVIELGKFMAHEARNAD